MKGFVNIVVAAFAATTPLFSSPVYSATRSDKILFSYCGEYSRGLGTASPGTTERAAIELPENISKKWEGNYITQVYVGYGTSSVNEVEVFVTEDLEGEPSYTQKAVMQKQGGWNIVTLDNPYLITGEPFYVGYGSFINNANDKPIGIDDNKNSEPYGSFIEIDGEWGNYSKYFGDVCIKIVIEGDYLPQNEAALENIDVPQLIQRNTPFTVILTLFNQGASPIYEVTASYKINGVSTQVPIATFPGGPIPTQSFGTVFLGGLICQNVGKNIPVEITLGLINGEENETDGEVSMSSTVDCGEKCFPLNMVVEEYTGTWCGWCPLGIVGMNYMQENYGDKGFIGIAVHYGDEMQVDSYADLALAFYREPGYPVAAVNRSEVIEPGMESLVRYYNEVTSRFSPVSVTVDAVYNASENILEATAVSNFAFDVTDSPYKVAFVLTENNVGPYSQNNYFSEGKFGETLEGWTDKGTSVLTMYNDVARVIKDIFGIDGSLPEKIESQTPYSYTTQLPLDNVKDISNCDVIALIINTESGAIVNGAKMSLKGQAAIDKIVVPEEDVYHVFNLQGVKVLETKDKSLVEMLPHGIYVINGKKILK